ncbi:hypothetical protein D9M71_114920 [compost metagenome]
MVELAKFQRRAAQAATFRGLQIDIGEMTEALRVLGRFAIDSQVVPGSGSRSLNDQYQQ